MKNLLSLIFIFHLTSFIFHLPTAHAANPTAVPTASPTTADKSVSDKLDKQINQLKDKIASRVSELNLVEKRGRVGTVVEVKGNQINMTDPEGNVRFVDVDEITKFSSSGSKGAFGLSDLTKGTKISVLGTYNKQSKRILARFISTYATPIVQSGAIVSLDTKNVQLMLMTSDKKEVKVDITPATKISAYAKDTGLVKYGFTKLAIGDRITIIGSPDKKDPTLLGANRIIDFIGIPKDPNIVITGATTPSTPVSLPVTPTAAAGKKLTPIR